MTQYTHIRNATGKLTIKNTIFLIDPFLAPKDTYPGFEGTFNYQQRMPIDRKSTRLNSSHSRASRMPSSA